MAITKKKLLAYYRANEEMPQWATKAIANATGLTYEEVVEITKNLGKYENEFIKTTNLD